MSTEESRRRELSKLVPNHVFSDQDLHKRFTVVNEECMADEVWNDCTSARPRLHRLFLALLIQLLNFFEKLLVNVGSFFI